MTLIAAFLLAFAVLWFFNSEPMAVDRCLDAGGRWSENSSCESAAPVE